MRVEHSTMLCSKAKKEDALQAEVDGLHRARDNIYQAPYVEWINARLSNLDQVLDLSTGESAIVLRRLLGPIKLEAQFPKFG